jgi:methionine synthase I (cobalamin-dependent)
MFFHWYDFEVKATPMEIISHRVLFLTGAMGVVLTSRQTTTNTFLRRCCSWHSDNESGTDYHNSCPHHMYTHAGENIDA